MSSYQFPILLCLLLKVLEMTSYKMHTALNSIVFTNIPRVYDDVHSEYFFGKCSSRNRELLLHEHFTSDHVVGTSVIMGYFRNTTKRPNCVYIRAVSPYGDMVRYNSYKFTVCIGSVEYFYMHEYYLHRFYEWYLPVEMREGIDWDLFFYRS